ncbi:hypothetical protein [Stenotrophomonas maltophilia]|uniref:hypothetical protein n=1 Tax=Stenotrophomonas maltophilia TaxID=40324 RepID=UPI000DE5F7D2|nr:hypothetical protein [Stenotrophomonas maltophilia]WNV14487.1 hypothetical protein RS400_20405 [Stenotrophomonas maltophilia]SSM86570.1 Uncharacterised protein [Acinetobacter baumannii]
MDAIEKRARELLAVVLHEMYPDDAGKRYVIDKLLVDELDLVSARGAIRALIAALTPPEEPDQALLVSMAMLVYHGFGLLTPEQKQFQLREMRKLWDEVMGRGYYSPNNRERYVAMLAARPEAP